MAFILSLNNSSPLLIDAVIDILRNPDVENGLVARIEEARSQFAADNISGYEEFELPQTKNFKFGSIDVFGEEAANFESPCLFISTEFGPVVQIGTERIRFENVLTIDILYCGNNQLDKPTVQPSQAVIDDGIRYEAESLKFDVEEVNRKVLGFYSEIINDMLLDSNESTTVGRSRGGFNGQILSPNGRTLAKSLLLLGESYSVLGISENRSNNQYVSLLFSYTVG